MLQIVLNSMDTFVQTYSTKKIVEKNGPFIKVLYVWVSFVVKQTFTKP